MKKKTIQKIIGKKFDDLLASIKDENVKNLMKQNTLISGGCIASMLMKSPVNDYDLYFTNRETTLAVARYYVQQFGEDPNMLVVDCLNVTKDHIAFEQVTTEDRIMIFIQSSGELVDRSFKHQPETPADSDVYDIESVLGPDKIEVPEIENPSYRPVYLSANAITLSDKIQLIIRFHGSPEQIHTNYDYVHCTNYWLSADRKVYLNQPALESILAKELVYIGSKYPIASIIRTRKFIGRGWQIHAGNYLKMCYQVSKLNLDDIDVLEDQLTGVDAAYFRMFIDAIKNAKKANPNLEMNYGYLSEIVDRIFNS